MSQELLGVREHSNRVGDLLELVVRDIEDLALLSSFEQPRDQLLVRAARENQQWALTSQELYHHQARETEKEKERGSLAKVSTATHTARAHRSSFTYGVVVEVALQQPLNGSQGLGDDLLLTLVQGLEQLDTRHVEIDLEQGLDRLDALERQGIHADIDPMVNNDNCERTNDLHVQEGVGGVTYQVMVLLSCRCLAR